MTATGQASVLAVTMKPSGARLTESRWLIHTVWTSLGVPSSKGELPRRMSWAGPYSPTSEWPTSPPSFTAMIWWP